MLVIDSQAHYLLKMSQKRGICAMNGLLKSMRTEEFQSYLEESWRINKLLFR
jgi:hypothetical protein